MFQALTNKIEALDNVDEVEFLPLPTDKQHLFGDQKAYIVRCWFGLPSIVWRSDVYASERMCLDEAAHIHVINMTTQNMKQITEMYYG